MNLVTNVCVTAVKDLNEKGGDSASPYNAKGDSDDPLTIRSLDCRQNKHLQTHLNLSGGSPDAGLSSLSRCICCNRVVVMQLSLGYEVKPQVLVLRQLVADDSLKARGDQGQYRQGVEMDKRLDFRASLSKQEQ